MKNTINSASLTDLPLTLKADHIAELLCISRAKAYTLMHSQGFPTMMIGKTMRVPRDKFLQWFEAQSSI